MLQGFDVYTRGECAFLFPTGTRRDTGTRQKGGKTERRRDDDDRHDGNENPGCPYALVRTIRSRLPSAPLSRPRSFFLPFNLIPRFSTVRSSRFIRFIPFRIGARFLQLHDSSRSLLLLRLRLFLLPPPPFRPLLLLLLLPLSSPLLEASTYRLVAFQSPESGRTSSR